MAKKNATAQTSDTKTSGAASKPAPDDRKWTVMVFMVADTVGGNASLVEAAKADIEEMRAVGAGPTLNTLVEVHGAGEPRRYHIGRRPTGGEPPPIDERDAPPMERLANFIRWSLRSAGHRPADNAMLVLWGHAYDFAFGQTLSPHGTVDAINFIQLGQVLRRLQDEWKAAWQLRFRPKMDIVAFDACDVSTVELACQLEPYARHLLASQIGVPIPGWPYDRVLGRLRYPMGRLMGTAEFGGYAVRRYCETYGAVQRTVSLTMLDLQRANELFTRTEILATAIDLAIGKGAEVRDRIKQLFSRAQTADYKPYVDLADLCLNLARESGDALVRAAAESVGDFLLSPRPDFVDESVRGSQRPFIVEHGRNSGATAKLNGISIYAPHVAPTSDIQAVADVYNRFVFAQETRWSRLVHDFASAC